MHMQSSPTCPKVCSTRRKDILGNHSPSGSLENTIYTQIEAIYCQNKSFRKVNIKYFYMSLGIEVGVIVGKFQEKRRPHAPSCALERVPTRSPPLCLKLTCRPCFSASFQFLPFFRHNSVVLTPIRPLFFPITPFFPCSTGL